MANKVEICNLALGNIRAGSINALTENSLEAQVCNQRFDLAVEFLLREYPWRFATTSTALSLLTDSPLEWAYAYDYPTDCLRALYVMPQLSVGTDRTIAYHFEDWETDHRQAHRAPWQLGQGDDGGRVILTNQAEAYLVYIATQTDASRFDPHFVEALSWYLASLIAVPIIGAETGRKLRAESLEIYKEILPAATARDANESYGVARVPESPTILERR